jgi:hypothetical protein
MRIVFNFALPRFHSFAFKISQNKLRNSKNERFTFCECIIWGLRTDKLRTTNTDKYQLFQLKYM